MSTQNKIQIPSPCSHLTEFRSKHGSHPFHLLQNCLRVKPLGRAEIRRVPLELPHCCSCGDHSSRLYACVSCASVFCHSTTESSNAKSHAEFHAESMLGHDIAVDIDRAELFCCACNDQVYDPDFDKSVVILAGAMTAGVVVFPPLRKRRRVDYRQWKPSSSEELLIRSDSISLEVDDEEGEIEAFPLGLRGLNNLGNTCFMNSVLQALIHTPPLRNYFLSDRHNRYVCQEKSDVISNGSFGNDNGKKFKLCLACDMDAVFSAMFSGDRMPYSPAKFLYSWWQHASNLASYEQQDAHEFFISMLDGIHEKVEKERGKTQNQAQTMETVALHTEYFLAFLGLTSHVPPVVSHLQHTTHVLTSH